jgi:hypothetical protein
MIVAAILFIIGVLLCVAVASQIPFAEDDRKTWIIATIIMILLTCMPFGWMIKHDLDSTNARLVDCESQNGQIVDLYGRKDLCVSDDGRVLLYRPENK